MMLDSDPLLHFAKNSLVLAQITHIHSNDGKVLYTLAHHISGPDYKIPKSFNHRNTRRRRYYLNKRCMQNPWKERKIGPLYTPKQMRSEDIHLNDCVLLDVKRHVQKGMYAVSYLPPRWASSLVCFFRYYTNHERATHYFQSAETRQILRTELILKLCEVEIPTLYHSLECLVTKNFSNIVDMLRFQPFRQTEWKSFEDIQSEPLIVQTSTKVPSTIDFVKELAFWAQDITILDRFANQLRPQLSSSAHCFDPKAQIFLDNLEKTKKYMKRVLKFMATHPI